MEGRLMSLILVVEDDPSILRGLGENLRMQSHEVLEAMDGPLGHRLAMERKPDLVILDLMLPDLSGFEVCRRLRADGFAKPILVLTARSGESDRVRGLDTGADDYMTKPFSIRELLARVRALLRRAEGRLERPESLRFDDIEIDFKSFEARKRGVALELTRKEFALLRVLAGRPGEAVSREELLSEVWGYKNLPTTRTVDTHVGTLRAKIENDVSAPSRLITVHGVGYKLTL
jgi:DNA-binding response OmpR family regulator